MIGETGAAGKVVKEYLYVNNQRVATVDYAEQSQGELAFVHNDHLGTPQLMTSTDAKVLWQSNTLPFGEDVQAANNARMKLKFPGQYKDQETGYSQNYFRDYDASLGRYIQSDPIGLAGGVNTFAYVGGNPVEAVDVYGLFEMSAYNHANPISFLSIGLKETTFSYSLNYNAISQTVLSVRKTGPIMGAFKRLNKFVNRISSPVGPKVKINLLNALALISIDERLKEAHYAKFGKRARLSKIEAVTFLTDQFKKNPDMNKYYDSPYAMLNKAKANCQ
ncbi:MAG: RHS repeat-associated core domain-containing protein [Oceanospirillaceae bacterium]